MKKNGFTLIELLLTMGLFAVLAAFATVNLIRPQVKSNVDRTTNTLIADIKQQQIKAMIGDATTGSTSDQGVYFDTSSYTLFSGSTYNVSDPDNIVITLEGGTTLTSINFPSNQAVFDKRSGEVLSYSSSTDDVTINHTGGVTTTISINEYGAISIN